VKLVDEKTGKEVTEGDELQTFRGEWVILESWREPHKEGSTGRVYVIHADGGTREYFPSVVGLVWRKE
jgi:hypothetical protein